MKEEKNIEEIVDEVTICREYDGDTFCYCTPEEVEKLLTHERTLREELKKKYQSAIGALLAEYHPANTTKTDEQKMGAYEALERLDELITPTDNH